MPIHLNMYM